MNICKFNLFYTFYIIKSKFTRLTNNWFQVAEAATPFITIPLGSNRAKIQKKQYKKWMMQTLIYHQNITFDQTENGNKFDNIEPIMFHFCI